MLQHCEHQSMPAADAPPFVTLHEGVLENATGHREPSIFSPRDARKHQQTTLRRIYPSLESVLASFGGRQTQHQHSSFHSSEEAVGQPWQPR
jgi:hypothetical protein